MFLRLYQVRDHQTLLNHIVIVSIALQRGMPALAGEKPTNMAPLYLNHHVAEGWKIYNMLLFVM